MENISVINSAYIFPKNTYWLLYMTHTDAHKYAETDTSVLQKLSTKAARG